MPDNPYRRVFFPYTDDKHAEVERERLAFVYYTSAETACRVLKSGEIWMRTTSVMNDYSEVEHGFECLNAAYKSDAGKALEAAFDGCFSGLTAKVVERFNSWLPQIRSDTFIACLSEHPDHEDRNGRLSMWRAYSRDAGVALVINPAIFSLTTPGIGVFSSPVAYKAQPEIEAELRRVAERVAGAQDFLRGLGQDAAHELLFSMFRFATLCTKHPGFAEEREWRIIASPSMHASPILAESVEVVAGVPQTVQKLKLTNLPEQGIVGLAIPQLLRRVIIGPCNHPLVVYRALHQLLAAAGVQNPGALIHISDIPLRATA